jgi:hypothetical protein
MRRIISVVKIKLLAQSILNAIFDKYRAAMQKIMSMLQRNGAALLYAWNK